jgi:hypothetical protein
LTASLMQSTAHARSKVRICSNTCAEQATDREKKTVD